MSDAQGLEIAALDLLRPRLPESGWRALTSSLKRVEAAGKVDIRTPFWGGESREKIVKTLESYVGDSGFSELEEIEREEEAKLGPLSLIPSFKESRSKLAEYWSQHVRWINDRSAGRASTYLSSLLGSGLRALSIDTGYEMVPKNTNWGLPYCSSDQQYHEEYLRRAKSVKSVEEIYPFVLFSRGQQDGPGKSVRRHVFGADHAGSILGQTILQPLLHRLVNHRQFSGWLGPDNVDRTITELIRKANGDDIISIDFKGFDRTLSRRVLDYVYDAIRLAFPERSDKSRVDLLRELITTGGLATPEGLWLGRNGGVASGETLTNMADSLAHLFLVSYCCEELGCELVDCTVMGDDGVHLIRPTPPMKELIDVMSDLGMTLNPDKQWVSGTSVRYLQRWHSADYSKAGVFPGVRPLKRALVGHTGQERWHDDWDAWMVSVRLLMQAEQCKHHPRFESYVRFLRDGDELLQAGRDPVEIFARAGGTERIGSVLSIEGFPYTSRDPGAIGGFAVTQELRKLNLQL